MNISNLIHFLALCVIPIILILCLCTKKSSPVPRYDIALPDVVSDIDDIMRGNLTYVGCIMDQVTKLDLFVGKEIILYGKIQCTIVSLRKFNDFGSAFDDLGVKFSSLNTKDAVVKFYNQCYYNPMVDSYSNDEPVLAIRQHGVVAVGIEWTSS